MHRLNIDLYLQGIRPFLYQVVWLECRYELRDPGWWDSPPPPKHISFAVENILQHLLSSCSRTVTEMQTFSDTKICRSSQFRSG